MERPRLTQRERNKLAKQYRTARYYDRNHYAVSRSYGEYIWRANGLERFMEYVEQLPGGRLLDVGAGILKAPQVIAKMHPDLSVEATTMTMPSKWDRTNSLLASYPENVHITSAERLRGVEAGVGGIIAVISTTYSVLPEVAVEAMDHVLRDGGALKMVCINRMPTAWYAAQARNVLGAAALAVVTGNVRSLMRDLIHTPRNDQVTTSDTYADLFQQKGYDVFTGPSMAQAEHSIVLAIKPDNANGTMISAQALYEADLHTMESQLAMLGAQDF